MQQTLSTSMPLEADYRGRKEYLLVIHPDEKVYNKVVDEKKAFYDQYRQKSPSSIKPQIVIADFMAKEEMEETLIRWIQRVSSQLKSFPVMLNNYSGFPAHTIYLRVQDHQPFKQLAAQLAVIDSYVRLNGYPSVKLISHPHLSIARRLSKEVYEEALVEYSQKIFCESFIAGELVLLRREHRFDTCRVVNVFRLLPSENNLNN